MERINPPDEQLSLRRGWIDQYNSGRAAYAQTTAQAGQAAGAVRLQLAGPLTDEEITAFLADIKTVYQWLLSIELLTYSVVPSEIPGADPEGISREWKLVTEVRSANGRRTYGASIVHACSPGDVLLTAILVSAAELSMAQGQGLKIDICTRWPAVLDVETIGLIELPDAEPYHVSGSARLRCESVRVETEPEE